MEFSVIRVVNEARAKREALAVVTEMADGSQQVITAEDVAVHRLGHELVSRFRSGKSGMVSEEGVDTFIQVYVPSPRLVIIGAVHISQALFPMAQSCGFDVTIIDPRSAFATPERFSDVELIDDWPEEVWDRIKPDAYTAIAALTHDPKIDDFALKSALEAECFYVGALGSRKTHAKRVDRLLADGIQQSRLGRIHSPIGLDIGAASPAEIAVAVMAEIIARLRKADNA